MAIQPCKECGGPVSDKAKSCPKCGAAQPKKTSVFTWVILGFIILTVLLAMFGGSKESNSNNKTNQLSDSSEAKADELVKKENWQNTTSNDEMRGTKSMSTATISTNQVNFAFPYGGGSNLVLNVRNNNKTKDVIIVISKGQFICGSLDGCPVSFKFDNDPVQTITMIGSDSHDSDILFINSQKTANRVIQKLKTSKRLIIEPKFYQEGSKQFTFDVSGFKEP